MRSLSPRALSRVDRRRGLLRRDLGGGGSRDDTGLAGLYALTNFSAANYYATPLNGGEAGVASGFLGAALIVVNALWSGSIVIVDRLTTSPSNMGWGINGASGNTIYAYFVNSTPALVQSAIYTITQSDVGRVLLVVAQHTSTGVRLAVNRVQVGADVAITGYTAGSGIPSTLGTRWAGNFPSTTVSVLSTLTARGTPSLAQLQASLYDVTRATVDLPTSIDGATVTHRISLKDQLLKAGGVIVNGQAAPAQLDDTVTGAAGDAMAKTGSPTVKVIDTSIDGRKSRGVFSNNTLQAYLSTLGGVRGSLAGHWVAVLAEITAVSQNAAFCACINGSQGYDLLQFGSTLLIGRRITTSGYQSTQPYTITTADLGKQVVLVYVNYGSGIRLYVQGVQAGADYAPGGTFAPADSATPFTALMENAASPIYTSNNKIFGVIGGDGVVPTAAEIAQFTADTLATGRLGTIAGKTTYRNDFSEVIPDGAVDVPTPLVPSIGTGDLARVDIDTPKVGPNAIVGVGPYATTDLWTSAAGGGVQGTDTGFNLEFDVCLSKVPTANEMLAHCTNSGGTVGWFLQAQSASLRFNVVTAGSGKASAVYTLTAADLNKRLRLTCQLTATGITLAIQGTASGVETAKGGTYTPPTGMAMVLGQFFGTQPFTSGWIEHVQGGNGVLTAGEITTLNADLTQAPPTIAGKTPKRWRFAQDVGSASKVPRVSTERIAGGDDLTRYGAGLQLAQRVERVWSYETTPIMKGVNAPTGSDRYEQPATSEWVGKTSFFVGLVARCKGPTNGRLCTFSNGAAAAGWQFNSIGGNTLQFIVADGSGTNRTAPSIAVAADGKVRCLLGVLDGPSNLVRAYQNRAQSGSGTACTGFTGSSAFGIALSSFWGGGSPTPDWDILGLVYGFTVPTLAQFQSWEDACLAGEDVYALGDQSAHMYSAKRALVGTTLKDLIGSVDMPATGSPVITDIYARAWSR